MASFLIWALSSAVINVRLALALLVTDPSRTRADAVQHPILPSVTIRISQCFLLVRCHGAFQVCAGKTAPDGMPPEVAPSMLLVFSHLKVSDPQDVVFCSRVFQSARHFDTWNIALCTNKVPEAPEFVPCTPYMQLDHSRFL